MKKLFTLFLGIFILLIVVVIYSCKAKESENESVFTAKPIVKNIGRIDVIVDPNIEMMILIGRLAGATPYNFTNSGNIPYIDEVDEYFKDFKDNSVILSTRNNNLQYASLPEFGIYLNETVTGFIMDIDNKNFIVHSVNDTPAIKIPYYAGGAYLESVRNFRQNSNFDTFFIDHTKLYEKIIDQSISYLSKYEFTAWLEDFYGIKIRDNINIYLTYLAGGYNCGPSIKNSKGEETLHSVLTVREEKGSFLALIAHEFSHPRTRNITEKLYKNEKIQALFSNLFHKNSHIYIGNGYVNSFYVLNETINQACANKFLEKIFPETLMERFNEIGVKEEQKWVYVPQIAEFLDNYENNRKCYKTLEDFIPELENFILTLE